MAGLIAPLAVPQPLDVAFRRDDVYVIVMLDHPDYALIEASMRKTKDGELLRAIVTQRDHRQIDHVNSEALAQSLRLKGREVAVAPMQFETTEEFGAPHVRAAFRSWRGEDVVVDCAGFAQPSAGHGGLVDPGVYMAERGLPLMWRDRSTVARAGAGVTINGEHFPAPVRSQFLLGATGYQAVLTFGHAAAILRGGKRQWRLIARPERFAPGETWDFVGARDRRVYRILSRAGDRLTFQAEGAFVETVVGDIAGENFEIASIRLGAAPGERGGCVLEFENGKFHCAMDGAEHIVEGVYESSPLRQRLMPQHPHWAEARALDTTLTIEGEIVTLVTRVGAFA